MGHQESIPQAALTTSGYLWATGRQILRMRRHPWDRDSLSPGKEMDTHGKATSTYTERPSLWHWEDIRHKEGMNRLTASTIRPLTPWRSALYDIEGQLAP